MTAYLENLCYYYIIYCLSVPLTSMGKNMRLESGLDEGSGRTRLMHSFSFPRLSAQGKPLTLKKRSCIGSCDPLLHIHTCAMICAHTQTHTHIHTPTHAVTHQ